MSDGRKVSLGNEVCCEVVDDAVALTKLSFTYPCKLMFPNSSNKQVALVYMLSFGGGLVHGDKISLKVQVKEGANLVLTTQSSTKVFKRQNSASQNSYSFQELKVDLGPKATFVLLPDPVCCFEKSCYQQLQTFTLTPSSNLVLLDWLSAGRTARGEKWLFDSYLSKNNFFQANTSPNELLFQDVVCLSAAEEGPSLVHRLRGYEALGMLIIWGKRFEEISQNLLEMVNSSLLTRSAAQKASSFLFSASPLVLNFIDNSTHPSNNNDDNAAKVEQTKGVVLRLAAHNSEAILFFLKDHLAGLFSVLGVDPWKRKM